MDSINILQTNVDFSFKIAYQKMLRRGGGLKTQNLELHG